MAPGSPPLRLRQRRAPSRLPPGAGSIPARAALLALLREPARLHALLRHLLALPLGPRDLPLVAAGPAGGAPPDAPLLCRLPAPVRPSWLLVEPLARRAPGRPAWARPWLAALRRSGQAGWLILVTDSDDVLRWAQARPLRARYGPSLEPRVLHLGRERERLLCPAAPLLAPLALWTARRWPAPERAPLLMRALRVSAALPPRERARQIALLLALFDPGAALQ